MSLFACNPSHLCHFLLLTLGTSLPSEVTFEWPLKYFKTLGEAFLIRSVF